VRVLITGVTGFIGRRLVSRIARRHEIFALVRHADVVVAGAETLVSDLRNPLRRFVLPEHVDAVVHLAQADAGFPAGATELFSVNTTATLELLDYARAAGAGRFVLASTGDVYGPGAQPRREGDELRPASFYGTTKSCAEALALSYRPYLGACILRLFRPYGPGQVGRLLPRLARAIHDGQPIDLAGARGPLLTPIFIDDVATAFERALESAWVGPLNVCGDETVFLDELAGRLGRALGIAPTYRHVGGEPAHEHGDNALMRRALGDWPRVTLDAGLGRSFSAAPDDRA
jgi:nucleoside-diphosphate-sugar epimerase